MSILSACKAAGIKITDRRNISMGGGDKRAKSRVTHIARHHSGVNVDQSMSILEGYWKNAHGWKTGGYHVVIHMDGSVDWNYDYDTISNGVGNHNSYIFNISVLGNGKFTAAQEKSWTIVCKEAQRELGIPTNNVWGHKEFAGHAYNSCPGIDMNTVRAALNSGKPVAGSNTTPDTNLKPTGKTIKVGTQAKQWQTGSDIPKFVIGGTYDVLEEKAVNQSRSKKAYLIGKGEIATGWLLEQDVDGFKGTSTATPVTSGKLEEDGIPGYDTYSALQKYFGTPVDGILSVPSPMVRKLQELVGAPVDGVMGPVTIKAMQAFFGTPVDGILSSPSSAVIKEIQKRLNAGNLGTKKIAAPAKNKHVYLPKSAKTWRVYKTSGPYTTGREVGFLAPAQYGGLNYEIIKTLATDVYEIKTGAFGNVAIYAAKSTGATIK